MTDQDPATKAAEKDGIRQEAERICPACLAEYTGPNENRTLLDLDGVMCPHRAASADAALAQAQQENIRLRELTQDRYSPARTLELEQQIAQLTADREALQAEKDRLQAEVQGGHARLDECSGAEATKDLPLYQRISKKIEQLVHEKQEADHMRQAVGFEMDELRARAGAAEHRRAAAEYRAQRIVLDAELKTRAERAEASLSALGPYLQHKAECHPDDCLGCSWGKAAHERKYVTDHEFQPKGCTCGLDDLASRIAGLTEIR